MKIIHLSDIHYCRENKELALASLRVALETGKREKIDLWALAGDLFDRGIQNSDKDGFGELLDIIRHMLDVAPMVTVQGTITHDVPGCYNVLTKINAEHNFMLLEPGREYYLAKSADKSFVSCDPWSDTDELLILGLPEPSKAWLLAGENGIGRDEANEKMKKGLRDILLGYGAVRRRNPSIPCLFLYHGAVGGSRACNGQTLTGDIEISKDDIKLIDSDIQSSYSGSVYPTDWVELDQKSFKLVTIDGNGTYGAFGHIHLAQMVTDSNMTKKDIVIESIPFPHAPRKKIISVWATADEPIDTSIAGFQVWQEYKATPEEKKQINIDEILKKMLAHGALPGSRVTISEIPTETVRAIEIQGVKSLPEKVTVWAKNSGLDVRESVLEKARTLEAEAKRSGYLPQPHSWRLRKVHVRGLKGIKRGMGLDDFEINYDDYDPGLLALVAENGTGKTSFMINNHFYTSMLIFGGKLQDYFCLRDSQRDVYATDEITGIDYYGKMLIDGKNKSGKAEYYLFKGSLAKGEWDPISNGKTTDYEEKVNELFGLEAIYMRSAFIPAEPTPQNPDLGYIAQGEKKRIFYELSGIGFYAAFVKSITASAKEIRTELATDETTITANQGLFEKLYDLATEKDEIGTVLGMSRIELEQIAEAGKTAKITLEHFAAIVKANGETQAKIDTLMKQKGSTYLDLSTWTHSLNTAKSFTTPEGEAKRKQAIEELDSAENIKDQVRTWTNDVSEKNKKRAEILEAYNEALGAYLFAAKAIEDPRAIATLEALRLKGERKTLMVSVDRRIEDLSKELIDKCPTCKKPLTPEEMQPLIRERKMLKFKLEEEQSKVFAFDQDIEAQKRIIKEKTEQFAALVFPPVPDIEKLDTEYAEELIKSLNFSLSAIDIDSAKATVKAADEARTKIVEAENQIATITAKIKTFTLDIDELTIKLDPLADTLYAAAKTQHESDGRKWSEKNAEIKGAEGKMSVLAKEIEAGRAKAVEIETLVAKTAKDKAELVDWDFLAEACGIDGIPALELDAVAPEISATANELLADCYGQRFQVEFRTTKISGAGSKRKQVEDFAIWIKDAEDGWEQEYSTLSGGEKTWIKKAISDAFEITRAKNTGIRYLTVFQDELDGKLDPVHKQVFFKLLEHTHQLTGRHHTILVTHSEAAQEQIAQKIIMQREY